MTQPWVRTASLLATLALATPAQATSLADRQLAWIEAHDGQEIIAPDGSILVPLVAVSNLLWLDPDGTLRDVGLIARDTETGDLIISWFDFGIDRITDDPASADFPYEATGRASPLADTFDTITRAPLEAAVGELPGGAWLGPTGTIQLTGSDASGISSVIGQWQFRGPIIAVALNAGSQTFLPTADILAAIEPEPD